MKQALKSILPAVEPLPGLEACGDLPKKDAALIADYNKRIERFNEAISLPGNMAAELMNASATEVIGIVADSHAALVSCLRERVVLLKERPQLVAILAKAADVKKRRASEIYETTLANRREALESAGFAPPVAAGRNLKVINPGAYERSLLFAARQAEDVRAAHGTLGEAEAYFRRITAMARVDKEVEDTECDLLNVLAGLVRVG
jgi:hypothetical protein